jgi:lycopene beta-cyclase
LIYDYVLVGGGLANGLVALALRARHPRVRIALVEAGPAVGGNHTWSFHETDLDERAAAAVEPLVVRRWGAVDVAFPDGRRTIPTGYATISSARFDEVLRATLAVPGSTLALGARAVSIGPGEVRLADGRRLAGRVVLDGRGPARPRHFESAGFQKFLGLEVELAPGAPLPDRPLLMDATVPQLDGYRFVYVLPLGARRALVEDTYYSDSPELERETLRSRVRSYLEERGFSVARVLREEAGALPIPWSHEGTAPLGSPVRLGYLGGWFHPTTGYSLPIAARVAATIAAHPPEEVAGALAAEWRALRRQARFCHALNRLLFRAAVPGARWQVFSRFYRLPQATIERFYALQTTATDRARIVCGRPPAGVTIRSALFPTQAV